MKRRELLRSVATLSLAGGLIQPVTGTAVAGEYAVTRSDAEGPYYPRVDIPLDTNLRLGEGFTGEPLQFAGRVIDTTGQPVDAARVEIWQCDGNGIYPHPAAPSNEDFDSLFRGFGAMNCTERGEFSFATIVPVPYTGRPPHIHAKIHVAGAERLTTQVYLEGFRGPRKRKITLAESSNGYVANFDFVLG